MWWFTKEDLIGGILRQGVRVNVYFLDLFPVSVGLYTTSFNRKKQSIQFTFDIFSPAKDLRAVKLLCLEKDDHSLENHTRDFYDLACQTQYQDQDMLLREWFPENLIQNILENEWH